MARKREVDRLVLKWRDRLWLGQWLVSVDLVDELEGGQESQVGARTFSDSLYRHANVKVSRVAWDDISPSRRNRLICHEMVHVATSSLKDFVDELIDEIPAAKRGPYEKWYRAVDESLTEHLCNVLLTATGEARK